jgi:hypothetical protein
MATINEIYQQILGRAPDAEGAAYWSNLFGGDVDANELASFRQAAAPEAYSNIYNSVSNGTMQYGDAIRAAAAAYDKPTNEYASTNNREMINLAFAATGKEPWYNDTSTALGGFSGNPIEDPQASWVGPKQSDFVNPYYQQGGAGYTPSVVDPSVTAAGQAALARQQAANSVPTAYNTNPDGSTTAQFAGGGSHSVAGPDSLSLLQGAYGAVPQQAQQGGAIPQIGQIPFSGAGSLPQTGSSTSGSPSFSDGNSWQTPQGGGYTSQNPYLSGMADDIGRRTQQGLDQAFNSIRSNSIGTGGYGGSRQGVAQGVAARGAMDSLQGNLASLFGGQYNQDANRDLTRYQADQGFYTSQRGQDLAGVQIGGDLIGKGVAGGWLPLNQASSIFNSTAGNNVSNTNTAQQGGGWLGALGGALGGGQLASNYKWW